jgi:hypothetical protein
MVGPTPLSTITQPTASALQAIWQDFDTSTPASTAALATWRPSFAAGLVGARVPGTSPLQNWSTRLTTFSATAGVRLDQS